MIRAVIFDLYETLVTEWDSEKYTSRRCAADLGLDPAHFRTVWDESHSAMNTGALTCADVWRRIFRETGVICDEEKISRALQRRVESKAQCFAAIRPEILSMLAELRDMGLRLALCSNGSADEMTGLRPSALSGYFDTLIVSCEVHLEKPQAEIYRLCTDRLGVEPQECIFIGDGGSRELYGASDAGMTPLRALWFLRGESSPMPYPAARTPQDAVRFCRALTEKG